MIEQQDGQAMTEYAATAGAMAAIIFLFSTDALPFFPYIVDLFQTYLDSLHMVVVLPIP